MPKYSVLTVNGIPADDEGNIEVAANGNLNLQQVTETGNETTTKITAANLNLSSIVEYQDNAAAIAGGLEHGDVYKIPYNNGNFDLAIVYKTEHFDITADWGNTFPPVTDELSFGEYIRYNGGGTVDISNFSLIGNKLTADVVFIDIFQFFLSQNVSEVGAFACKVNGLNLFGAADITLENINFSKIKDNLVLRFNSSQAIINDTLVQLDSLEKVPKQIDLTQLTTNSFPTGSGLVAKQSLKSKGIFMFTDVVPEQRYIEITATWGQLGVSDQASFIGFLQQQGVKDIVITNFNLTGNVLKCDLDASVFSFSVHSNGLLTMTSFPFSPEKIYLSCTNGNIELSSLDLTNTMYLVIYGNYTQFELNSSYVYLDSIGKSAPFLVSISNNSSPYSPTGAGLIARNNLISRGVIFQEQ